MWFAHVVADATFLQVQRTANPEKTVARVKSICHDCDLALLEVTDPNFMDGVEIAELGELPNLQDRVSVSGFPVGGDEVSITEGVVSRIQVQHYAHSQRYQLAVTVDAAINDGNSGGPVFKDGRVVGIAFQGLRQADGIGELVPPPLIRHFLQGAAQGLARVELPGLGVITQKLENPTLRSHVGLSTADSGILVVGVQHGSSADTVLQKGDALLAIGDHPIANNGTVRYLSRYRCHYEVLLLNKQVGDELPLTILRQGQRRNVSLRLKPKVELVPNSRYDVSPTFYIYGGLVFQPLTRDFITTWGSWWDKAPKEFLHLLYSGRRTAERQEVIILSQVLADEINAGYEHFDNETVVSVNGTQPRDMRHFVQLLEHAQDVIEIVVSSQRHIVMTRQAVRAANPGILERYHIDRDRSKDLM